MHITLKIQFIIVIIIINQHIIFIHNFLFIKLFKKNKNHEILNHL